MDFGSIKPIDLTEERKLELEAQMALAFEVLKDAAFAISESDNPADIRYLRDGHLKYHGTRKDPLRRYPGARRCVAGLRAVEEEVLGGYIRTLSTLCVSFATVDKETLDMELEDWIAEAAKAVWDAMFVYDGRCRFTTFIYSLVKNRLTSCHRQQSRNSAGSRVRELKKRVKRAMADGMTLEIAIEQVIREEGLTDAVVARVRQALVSTQQLSVDVECDGHDAGLSEETARMWQALRQADLSPLQRELVEAYLRGDRGFRRRVCQSRTNPSTKKPFTRSWLSQLFQKACLEIQECLANSKKRNAA
jgi:DNA-directed RNA polymerase specialized sigma24 family protein